jgi:hypothetical protein
MNPLLVGALIGAGATLLGAFIGYLNTRQQLKYQAAQAQRTHHLEKLVELGRLIDETATNYMAITVRLGTAHLSKPVNPSELIDKMPNQAAIRILTLIYAPELVEMHNAVTSQIASYGEAAGVLLYQVSTGESPKAAEFESILKKGTGIRDAYAVMSEKVAELAKRHMATTHGEAIGVNLKGFLLALVVLFGAATIYPPYLWGQEKIEEWRQLAGTGNVKLIDEYPKGVPRKMHGFLFGKDIVEIQTGWTWDHQANKSIPLIEKSPRRINWENLLLEYVLALCVAIIIGVLTSARKLNRDG